MTTTGCATSVAPDNLQEQLQGGPEQPSPEQASRPLRGIFFGFAATVTVGLILTIWYLGVRIVTAGEVPQPSAAQSSAASAAISAGPPPSPARPVELTPLSQPALFLQTAGLGPRQDAAFVRLLKTKGFQSQIQKAGGRESRIVVGPFASRGDLEKAQRKLQASGILAIETTY